MAALSSTPAVMTMDAFSYDFLYGAEISIISMAMCLHGAAYFLNVPASLTGLIAIFWMNAVSYTSFDLVSGSLNLTIYYVITAIFRLLSFLNTGKR